jgi:hypothetical protein
LQQVDVTSFAADGEEAEEEKPYKWQVSNGKGQGEITVKIVQI